MTRAEAQARAASLNAEAARDTHWMVRQAAGDAWEVVRMSAPGLGAIRPSGSHSESRPEPSEPPDPRPALIRNIPPFGPA